MVPYDPEFVPDRKFVPLQTKYGSPSSKYCSRDWNMAPQIRIMPSQDGIMTPQVRNTAPKTEIMLRKSGISFPRQEIRSPFRQDYLFVAKLSQDFFHAWTLKLQITITSRFN
jgi:hypothetical protein